MSDPRLTPPAGVTVPALDVIELARAGLRAERPQRMTMLRGMLAALAPRRELEHEHVHANEHVRTDAAKGTM